MIRDSRKTKVGSLTLIWARRPAVAKVAESAAPDSDTVLVPFFFHGMHRPRASHANELKMKVNCYVFSTVMVVENLRCS